LPKGRKAISHYHKISKEIYYVFSGNGKVRVGDESFEIKRGALSSMFQEIKFTH